jgi:hypothetical protein
MTIDIALLRNESEGGRFEQVWKSQCLRYPELDSNQLRQDLGDLQEKDVERRRYSKNLEQQRNKLNQLRRLLNPKRSPEILEDHCISLEDIKGNIGRIQETIQQNQNRLKQLDKLIRSNLCKIGNLLDTDVNIDTIEIQAPTILSQDIDVDVLVDDPLFCLGAYERIQVESVCSFTSLNSIALDLERAIECDLSSYLSNEIFPVISIPQVCFPTEWMKSILGFDQIVTSQQTQAACLTQALMIHQNKKYWDRELPQGNVILSKRELKTLGKRKWYCGIQSTEIELIALGGCTLEESRTIQRNLVHRLFNWYQGLLISSCSGYRLQSDRHAIMLRKNVALPPSHLQPFEVSKINVEGYLHGKYVVLASVSNCTDYLSRELNIRCGGVHVDYVHTVHASCSTILETLEWIAHANICFEVKSQNKGIGIPKSLAHCMGYTQSTFLPFQKQVIHKSAGRKSAVENLPTVTPSLMTMASELSEVAYQSPQEPFAFQSEPNQEAILAERHMNPFEFLPML